MKMIELSFDVKKPILACGADLKGAFAFAQDRRAFLFDGFGDLSDLDNFTAYEDAVKRYERKLCIKPKIIACDLHPDYFSSHFAENYTLFAKRYTLIKIQHHEAHVASAVVDNSGKGGCLGVAFDGTGFGSDGNIWGGEFFIGSPKKFKRVGHLEYVPMPGQEQCIKEPWRMAAVYLYKTFGDNFPTGKKRWRILKQMIDKKLNSPLTSSAGRLFDAVGSIILAKDRAEYEAALPIEMERLAEKSCEDAYDFDIESDGDTFIISAKKIIRRVMKDVSEGVDKGIISARFHNTVADMIVRMAAKLRKKFGINKVALSGGVFQNKFLTARAVGMLEEDGFGVYAHSNIPVNDSGIPIGQIAIANAKIKHR